MRPKIKAVMDSWSQRVTAPQTMHDAAPLLWEASYWLGKFGQVINTASEDLRVVDDAEKLAVLEGGQRDLCLLQFSIEELLIRWGFNKDELNMEVL